MKQKRAGYHLNFKAEILFVDSLILFNFAEKRRRRIRLRSIFFLILFIRSASSFTFYLRILLELEFILFSKIDEDF